MDISFANESLHRECESGKRLQRAYGQACAKQLAARFKDLEAAALLEEFRNLPGHCHELDGDRKGQLALHLPDGKRLVFEPVNNPAPRKQDGGLDWAAVDAVRILEITDYH